MTLICCLTKYTEVRWDGHGDSIEIVPEHRRTFVISWFTVAVCFISVFICEETFDLDKLEQSGVHS